MKIRDLQTRIADALNGLEDLLKGGCKAFAEDALDVRHKTDVETQVKQGVAIVVITPDIRRNGCSADGIPVDTKLKVNCIEAPSLNRKNGHLTALDAAEVAAHALDSDAIQFEDIQQRADETKQTLVATVTFNVAITLTT